MASAIHQTEMQPPSPRMRARPHQHCQTHNTRLAFFLLAAQSFATVLRSARTQQRPNFPVAGLRKNQEGGK